MRPRQSLLEIFSTFLQFEADRFNNWATDARLRRNMQNHLVQSSETLNLASQTNSPKSEEFWAIYWYKLWQSQPTGIEASHLSAYLQEVCYWAAQKTIFNFSNAQYTLSDCFQVAISRLDKILKGFNLNQGSNLKRYASIAFNGLIREFLRQRQIVDICSDWSLLRKVSQKRLISALETAMFSAETIQRYVLAWNCLKAVYVPSEASSTRRLPKPSDGVWQAIAKLYNTERKRRFSLTEPECNPATLERWLQDCVKAVRAYLYPGTTSINALEQEFGDLADGLLGGVKDSLLTELIAEEENQARQTQRTQLNQVLTSALATLDLETQQLLELYYAHELTQQQIAERLGIKQYTISRRFSKAKELLLRVLAEWSQELLHITLTSDLLKYTSALLEEWLVNHYRHSDVPS